jgi:putative transposase
MRHYLMKTQDSWVQKLNYIHNNPVEAGIVEKAEDYLYSSARSYQQGKKEGLLKVEFL